MRWTIVAAGMVLCEVCLGAMSASAMTDEELNAVRSGFESRRDQMLRRQVSHTYPPPANRGDHLSVWNRLDYALAALFLNVEIEQANRAVIEATEHSAKEIRDAQTKKEKRFHWEAPLYCRIYELFYAGSRFFPGRLHTDAAEAIRKTCWEWARQESRLEAADPARAWHFWGSENHSAMRDVSIWGIARILKDSQAYASLRYDDGSTAAQQYEARTRYAREYFRQRICRGLTVETGSPTYSKYTLQCWYNYFDFADDPQLQQLADAALTVYWAEWAQEQIDGVRGGGKSRCYQGEDCEQGLADAAAVMAWYYLGIGRAASQHPGVMCMATTRHRLPLVVMDIALDVKGRGVYECRSRRPGLRAGGASPDAASEDPESRTVLDPDFGGIVKYSYAAPGFILGTNLLPKLPMGAWSGMSMQNRWQGVIFAGHPDARIFPQCQGLRNGKTYNQQWSVQNKGTLITQKLPDKTYSKQAGDMRVWFAASLQRSELQGWVFAEARDAFAAVRPASGGFGWDDAHWLRCRDSNSPVILEVASREAFASLDTFQKAVLANRLAVRNGVLTYQGLGDAGEFTFDLQSDRLPEVNGKPIELRPSKTFDSPFLQEDWAGGKVTISKGSRTLTIDIP